MPQLTPQNWITLLAISSILIFQLEHTFSINSYNTFNNNNLNSNTLNNIW